MFEQNCGKCRKTLPHNKSVPRYKKFARKSKVIVVVLKRHLIVCKGEKVDIKYETYHKKFKTKWFLRHYMVTHKEKGRTF